MNIEQHYGIHRVLEPRGSLPQQAWRIDNTPKNTDNELLIDIEVLNIDSASFNQMKEEANGNMEKVKEIILRTVKERGKQHNPVTGSGGMLVGRIMAIGTRHPANEEGLEIGDDVATLVSLSLTPLYIEEINQINEKTSQIFVKGKAIIFSSGIYAKLPDDLPRNIALAILDVAGAPAQTIKLVKNGDTVVVLGAGGKSGLLASYQARKIVGNKGRVIALEYDSGAIENLKKLEIADEVYQVNAQKPLEVLEVVNKATNGNLADITINCVNVVNTEMSSILITKDKGRVYFFSMATSFTAAALGAEGVGKDIEMIIGNGYTKGHAEVALNIIRESKSLKEWFEKKYV